LHSWLGSWVARDPSSYNDGHSLYAYTNGNPITYVDPHGTETVGPHDGVGGYRFEVYPGDDAHGVPHIHITERASQGSAWNTVTRVDGDGVPIAGQPAIPSGAKRLLKQEEKSLKDAYTRAKNYFNAKKAEQQVARELKDAAKTSEEGGGGGKVAKAILFLVILEETSAFAGAIAGNCDLELDDVTTKARKLAKTKTVLDCIDAMTAFKTYFTCCGLNQQVANLQLGTELRCLCIGLKT
jgi:hypothetical protein